MKRLVLWDIDGTLASTDHAGSRACIRALHEVYGIQTDLSEIDIRGATDWRIFNELCAFHKLPNTPEAMETYFNAYFKILPDEIRKGRVWLHPGVAEILPIIDKNPDFAQGLLTGNMPRGAQIKLEAVNVWKYFPFGAFGSDNADRNKLSPIAVARAKEKTGWDFEPKNIFILGDTPHDVDCARVINAKAVAVATGGHTKDALAQYKPDYLFETFADSKKLLSILES